MSLLVKSSLWHNSRDVFPITYEVIDRNISIPSGGTYTPLKQGIINCLLDNLDTPIRVQLYHSTEGWIESFINAYQGRGSMSFLTDGENVRLYNPSGYAGRTIYAVLRRPLRNVKKYEGTLSGGSTLLLPKGLIMPQGNGNIETEAYDGSAWNEIYEANMIPSDGENVRLHNIETTSYPYVFIRADWK